ncbi:putative gustatory receptor 89a [Lucilia sericata]|uniref:putative gustatory receptor 89a n=1 Tax=Lucilia sericata TaxID=13632 RepID=UPI0018A81AAA|nr:putative gustatory receptor 89a [Lucilia sericata]
MANITKIAPEMESTSKSLLKWKFRTHRLITAMAIFLCIFYIVVSPFMFKMASDLYSNTRSNQDNLFIIIAKVTMANDVVCSLLLMITHICYRERIVEILNLFNEIVMKVMQLDRDFVSFKIMVALMLKMSLCIYEMFLNFPFIIKSAYKFSTQSIVAFVFVLYLQELNYIFALNIFVCILIMLCCSLQLEKEFECKHILGNNLKILQLIDVQNSLQKLIRLFIKTFQFGIFLNILLYFVTILCNIYALLDYYVTTQHLFRTFIVYILSVALELYSLILVTYLCNRSQRQVKDLLLQREELYFMKSPGLLSIVETDMIWPQLQEFTLLGLFTINNEFALFLLSYSVNFIVIILEFAINKAAHKL